MAGEKRPAGLLLLAAIGLMAVAAAAHAAATPWSPHGSTEARLLVAPPADDALRLGLHIRLQPGWHVYWKDPGDAGAPPDVTAVGQPAVGATRILYPPPRTIPVAGGLRAIGYEGEVVYPVRVE